MYEASSDKEHKSASVDVTDRCNLRCKHCFYYREEHESEEMDGDEFLKGLRILRDRHNMVNISWCGGEPLYRPEVVEEGMKMFEMNNLFTNGTLPIPDSPGLVTIISLDGTRDIHDEVRGKGTYDKIIANIEDSSVKTVLFSATFHRLNEMCMEDMIGELSRMGPPFAGLIVSTFTPLKTYERVYAHSETQEKILDFSWEERDAFLDRLMVLKDKYPHIVLNDKITLEMMKSHNAPDATSRCNMPKRTLCLDLKLNRKLPCLLGADVDCSKCGCPFPYEQEARRRGLKGKSFFYS